MIKFPIITVRTQAEFDDLIKANAGNIEGLDVEEDEDIDDEDSNESEYIDGVDDVIDEDEEEQGDSNDPNYQQRHEFSDLVGKFKKDFLKLKRNIVIRIDSKEVIQAFDTQGVDVRVCGKTKLIANATFSFIKAYDESFIIAKSGARVEAFDRAVVEANDSSRIQAYDHAYILAFSNSAVDLEGNTSCVANDKSKITAKDNSNVLMYGKSSIEASGQSVIHILSTSVNILEIKDSATVIMTRRMEDKWKNKRTLEQRIDIRTVITSRR